MIRMIATDLDGTMMAPDGRPSVRTMEAIHRFAKQGGIFVPVTGRPGPHVGEDIWNSPDIRYYLHSNGARCVENLTREEVFVNTLSADAARRALEIARPYTSIWHLFYNGTFIRDDHEAGDPHSILLDMLFDPALKIEKLDLTPESLEERKIMWDLIEKEPDIAISSAYSHNMELNGVGGDKGSGVTMLAERLGIRKDEIMAFGDGRNDVALLKAAGFAVAMGNAVEPLKAVADFVTLTNAEDGEAYAIEKFALGG